jgi:hypothetical protein
MGLFLSVSGVINADKADVARALAEHVASKRGILEAESRSPEDDDTLVLCSEHGNTTVYFPANDLSWWETSQAVSRLLKRAVFAFHIHDGDLWMYELYKNGAKIDAFNPVPDYWMELSEQERASYKGNAKAVSECAPHVKAVEIARYLVIWDLENEEATKAYASDEHAYGSEWQLLDFMKKLRLPYPLNSKGQPRGPTYEFIIPAPKPGP